jgi:hypothetical protein
MGAAIRAIWGTFGVAVVLLSAMFVAIAITELVTGEGKTERSTLVGLVVLFTGAGFWGLNIARGSFGWRLPVLPRLQLRRRSRADKEQAVIALAVSLGGRLTLLEAAGRCQMTLQEAEQILHDLVAREVAELLVTEDGTLVYEFNVLTRKEKARAKDFLQTDP